MQNMISRTYQPMFLLHMISRLEANVSGSNGVEDEFSFSYVLHLFVTSLLPDLAVTSDGMAGQDVYENVFECSCFNTAKKVSCPSTVNWGAAELRVFFSRPQHKTTMATSNLVFASTDMDSVSRGFDDDVEDTHETKTKAPKGYVVHIRNQQRSGRKSLTLISGLPDDLNLQKIVKVMRKMFNTNGTILKDDEGLEVIQIQGDRRKDALDFLVKYKVAEKECIKVHGF
eukprot:g64453.t1